MTGRNPVAPTTSLPGCPDVAYGPRRLDLAT
jgi:hypothetical protein